MAAARLPEIAECDATGSVAETYADVRAVIGVPFVATIYRVLATRPGLLQRLWQELRPNVLESSTRRAAAELAAADAISVEPLPAASVAVTALNRELTTATLSAYRRLNSHNPIIFATLLDGTAGRGTPSEPESPPGGGGSIMPMPDLARLDPATVALLEEMSEPVSGGVRPLLVPGLIRHFAAEPPVLALLWSALRPALYNVDLDARADGIWNRAREVAAALPHPVARLEDQWAREVVQRFSRVFPKMLLVGDAIEAALAETLR